MSRVEIIRHLELFDPRYFNENIHIIGAGATGSWLALMFAKLGVKGEQIHVWDFDHIEDHNIANQAYDIGQVGELKVEALFENILQSTLTKITPYPDKFEQGRLDGYVFLMVDSMAERERIWKESIKFKPNIKLMVEPRMGLDIARIYNVDPMNIQQHGAYEDTLYSDEEAETSACGASQTVITSGAQIASICARQLINNEAGEELDNEILIDFIHNNLITSRWEG